VARPKALRLTEFEGKLGALENAALRNAHEEIHRILPEFNLCFESGQTHAAGQD